MFVKRQFDQEKKELINQRHLLLCDNCYWCLSYLPDFENNTIQHFWKCPKCRKYLRRMYISEKTSHRFDEQGSQELSEYQLLAA